MSVLIRFDDVVRAEHQMVLQELLAGEFAYTPDGGETDSGVFLLEFGLGEYGVVTDELLDKKRESLVRDDVDSAYRDVYDLLPSSASVEDGDEVEVSFENV